jgi:hypothetical protein
VSETLKIISLGLLLVFISLMLIGIEDFFGMNWMVCLASRTCFGALEEILTSRFPSERSGEACSYPAMVEFIHFIFYHGPMDFPCWWEF